MLRHLLIVLAAVSGLMSLPVRAQDQEAQRLVGEILDATEVIKQWQASAPLMIDEMSRLILGLNPDKGPEINRLLKAEFAPRVIARLPEIKPLLVALYAQTFTLDELRYLHAYSTSEMGRRIAAKQTQMSPLLTQVGQAFGQKLSAEIIQELTPKFRENGIKL